MQTLELLAKAAAAGPSLRTLSCRLGLSANALAKAKHEGRLSPGLAAAVAAEIGEDVPTWVLVATAESERNESLRDRLQALAQATARRVRKS